MRSRNALQSNRELPFRPRGFDEAPGTTVLSVLPWGHLVFLSMARGSRDISIRSQRMIREMNSLPRGRLMLDRIDGAIP
jgi:hypothetical protein